MKSYTIKILLLLVLLAMAYSAGAQNSGRINSDFNKLQRYIDRVQELVNKFDDQRARNNILLARQELEKARYFLYAAPEPRYQLAKAHLLRAKAFTDLAAKMVLSKPFKKLKVQLDDLIDRAEQQLGNSRMEETYYLLNQAKKFRRLAYENLSSGRVLRGEQYYRVAFFFARKCMDYQKTNRLSVPDQRIELELSVQQMLNQARELTNGNDNAAKMLQEAEKHYQNALQLADEGKEEQAVNRLKLVRRYIYRIYDQSERGAGNKQQQIKSQLYSLKAFLESLENDIEPTMNEQTRTMINKSWQLYKSADLAFSEGNFNQAAQKISISQRVANKVFRQHRNRNKYNAENIAVRIEETNRILQIQKDQVFDTGNEGLIKLYQEAQQLLDRAREASNQGNMGQAFQILQGSTRMSARVQREIRRGSFEYSEANLEQKFNQIQNSLRRIENNEKLVVKHRNVIDQLQFYTEQGRSHWQQKNYVLADEYFDTVLEQIKQYTAKWRK